MRKLSKKISMLMVLAMLVSLFSGVVSASAASSWSFYNKTADEIVAVKETIEMETNEFADFDLFKDGKTIDTDVYTVKYESSDASVVFVDAKNGKMRAKGEAGEKATFTAVITNKTTKVTARRSFNVAIADAADYAIVADFADEVIAVGEKLALSATVTADGKEVDATVAFALDGAAITEFAPAEAGEYTIVATATVDGEVVTTEKFVVVAEDDAPEFVAAKQIALNTVELTLNSADWAKKLAGNVKLSYFAGNVEIADLVKSVAVKEGAADTAVVTLYNALTADTTYKFAFAGYESSITVVGAKTDAPASIKVVGGNVAAGEEGQLDVKIFNAAGVDITSDALKANVTYSVAENSDSVVAGDKIYFFAVGKTAVVNATYEMGWDDNGNENTDLKASGIYTSVAAYTFSNLNGYATSAGAVADDSLTYNNSIKISLSDGGDYLHAKYTRTKYDATTDTMYVVNGTHNDAENTGITQYKYYSTNESVLLVNETSGVLSPCSTGVTSVYIKDNNGTVVGSVTITVEGARKLNSFTATNTDRMLSAGVAGFADSLDVTVATKDALGAAYAANYSYELVNLTGAYTDYVEITEVDNNGDGVYDKLTIAPSATAINNIDDKKVKVVTIKITAADAADANNKKTANISLSIKDMQGVDVAATTLDLSATTVDMKLNKKAAADYNVTAKLVKKDAAGYDLGLQAYNYITAEAAAVTANGEYSIIIKKNTNQAGEAATGLIDDTANTITFSPVTGATPVEKTEKATYTIKVFKGNGTKAQLFATKTLTITDSTNAISVVVNKTNLAAATVGEVEDSLDFYRDGVKITNKVTVTAFKDTPVAVGSKTYVKTITVTVLNDELNSEFAGNHSEDVAVNQLYTIE